MYRVLHIKLTDDSHRLGRPLQGFSDGTGLPIFLYPSEMKERYPRMSKWHRKGMKFNTWWEAARMVYMLSSRIGMERECFGRELPRICLRKMK